MPSVDRHQRRPRDWKRSSGAGNGAESNQSEQQGTKSRSRSHSLQLSSDSGSRSSTGHRSVRQQETDPVVLARREKQIEYGKNNLDYEDYTGAIPKSERRPGMPTTPDKTRKYSRRQWDGMIKAWKIDIHNWTAVNPHELRRSKKSKKEASSATEEDTEEPTDETAED